MVQLTECALYGEGFSKSLFTCTTLIAQSSFPTECSFSFSTDLMNVTRESLSLEVFRNRLDKQLSENLLYKSSCIGAEE